MIARALLSTEDHRRMFETSVTFRMGIEAIVQVATLAVDGLVPIAEQTDRELEQRVALAKRQP